MDFVNLASRIFGTPLMIHPAKLSAIMMAIGPRMGMDANGGGDAMLAGLKLPHGDELASMREGLEREAYTPRFGSFSYENGYYLDGGVAVVPISGTLVHKGAYVGAYSGLTSYEGVTELMSRAVDDARVQHIIMNAHTYGGEVSGCFDAVDAIVEMRELKPITALVSDAACSAGYALCSGAERMVVTQTSHTGSIGVLMRHFDWSQRMETEGVKITEMHIGEHKTLGSPYRPLSPEDKARIETELQQVYDLFVAKSATNRGVSEDVIRDTQAAVFGPDEAVKIGLADEVMSGRELLQSLKTGGRPLSGGQARSLKSESTKMKDGENGSTANANANGADQSTEDTQKATATAKAQGHETGLAAGADAERQRIQGIVNCEAAEGRKQLAEHFAFNTGMSVEDAQAALAASPTEAPAKTNALADAMANTQQPQVGSGDADPAADDEDAQAQAHADRILAAHQGQNAIN